MAAGSNFTASVPARGGLPPLVAAMTRAAFYPQRPARVELIQTHISYVFLTDEYVYKVKKAVRFPFIDCATLERRRRLCHEEVRLNRRLAPTVYLGVLPIVQTPAGFALGDSSATDAVEYAVQMRRLPQERMLDRMIEHHEALPRDLRTIAQRIADFHRQAATGKGWLYGSAAAVYKMVRGNLTEAGQLAGKIFDPADLDAIDEYNHGFIETHWNLLNSRAREGRVCEGHGDLRCEHICMDSPPTVFDCVEFSERLRYADVASELAFLAMDLERLAAPSLSRALTEAYIAASGDRELATLLPFYQCYRAMVRAKVDGLKSLAREVPEPERLRARDSAHDYLALARRYLTPIEPAMLMVCGLSGSGKSTLARALSRRLGFDLISSDVIRKQLAGIPPTSRATADYGGGIYSEAFNRRTYITMLAEAEERIRKRRGVILDATFRHADERRLALEAAARAGVRTLFVECRAPVAVALERIAQRERRGGEISDANAAIYARQLKDFEPLDELPPETRLAVDSSVPPAQAAAAVMRALAARPAAAAPGPTPRRSNLRQLLNRF
jgi:aminoglycoside phosphotransferase family enzyme/predicted kinase